MNEFKCNSVPCLKEYLTNRGIQVSHHGRNERKAELVELAEKVFQMIRESSFNMTRGGGG